MSLKRPIEKQQAKLESENQELLLQVQHLTNRIAASDRIIQELRATQDKLFRAKLETLRLEKLQSLTGILNGKIAYENEEIKKLAQEHILEALHGLSDLDRKLLAWLER